MKKAKSEFKQLTRDQLKRITGGTQSSELNMCGWQAGGARCPNGECCSIHGFCGTTIDYCLEGCNCQLDCFPC